MAITPDHHFAQIERELALEKEREQELRQEASRAPEPQPIELDGPVDEAVVRRLLSDVIDPELGLDIVELGLLREITIADGTIDVCFTVTTPACPLSEFFIGEIRSRLEGLPGIDHVEPRLVFVPPWGPEQMSEDARFALGISD